MLSWSYKNTNEHYYYLLLDFIAYSMTAYRQN